MLPLVEGGVPAPASVVALGDVAPTAIAFSSAEEIPFAEGAALLPSLEGVAGLDRCGATSSGSTSSGGRRSFSISDLRLFVI